MSTTEVVRFVPSLPWLLAPRMAPQAASGSVFPFSEPRLHLTFSGTAAIAQATRVMGLGPGSRVLCPAYHCGHEIEPFFRAGCEVDLYRVRSDLQIDVEDIAARLVPGIKALLVTHYFGFPQRHLAELKELCRRNGTLLVEDCAHALFSDGTEGPLGSTGDLSVFSFRKTLPLPHGGGLLINDPHLGPLPPNLAPSNLSTLTKAIDLYKKSLLQNLGARHSPVERANLLWCLPLLKLAEVFWRLDLPSRTAWYDPDDEGFGFADEILRWGMSAYCRRLLPGLSDPGIRDVRRGHWLILQERLAGLAHLKPAFPELPPGVCPLFFPILIADRTAWVKRLQENRIYAAPWWEALYPKVALQDFPDALELKARMIALPLHQDLSAAALARMTDFLRNG